MGSETNTALYDLLNDLVPVMARAVGKRVDEIVWEEALERRRRHAWRVAWHLARMGWGYEGRYAEQAWVCKEARDGE